MINKIWVLIGRVGYIIIWPILYFYLPCTLRTRVLIICDDEILAVKGWLGANKWYLPGGGVHRHETPKEGAIREISEELGIDLNEKDLQLVCSGTVDTKGLRFTYEQFVVVLEQKPKLKIQTLEIVEAKWLKVQQVTPRNCTPALIGTLAAWEQVLTSGTIK